MPTRTKSTQETYDTALLHMKEIYSQNRLQEDDEIFAKLIEENNKNGKIFEQEDLETFLDFFRKNNF